MNKYIVEFLGTFFLVFIIGVAVIEPGLGIYAPLAIGLLLIIMIYAGAKISGAHYNPAVTISLWLRGRFNKDIVPYYIISQVIAGVAAAVLIGFIKDQNSISTIDSTIVSIFFAELIFTFVLCFVILYVATSKKTEGNSYYGLAIGLTVIIGAYAVGSVSGGAFNPAVALGITVMGLSAAMKIWVYFVANFTGGIIAALIFKILNADDS
ncbi:MAG: porin [Candidatus Dadabacteria bacterium]|nr:porin [Candidatus Dadabacteria bacterium]NIS09199.1 porin [Candidatus Dadabacteria bacterium]NIV41815.1 porin [Candidatus Dadabacteria bacterium]NIX15758.1 porin [Candidatus Dadabacteria bacterium]NIY22630.1 porin [Candidatus Dadabacteria bacterium]